MKLFLSLTGKNSDHIFIYSANISSAPIISQALSWFWKYSSEQSRQSLSCPPLLEPTFYLNIHAAPDSLCIW